MSERKPWETHGHQWQTPGPMQMFDPSQFHQGVQNPAQPNFNPLIHSNPAQANFNPSTHANPPQPNYEQPIHPNEVDYSGDVGMPSGDGSYPDSSWIPQQPEWYGLQGAPGHQGLGNNEYDWSMQQSVQNQGQDVMYDGTYQLDGAYENWQPPPEQNYYYGGEGYLDPAAAEFKFPDQHHLNYSAQEQFLGAQSFSPVQNLGSENFQTGSGLGMNCSGERSDLAIATDEQGSSNLQNEIGYSSASSGQTPNAGSTEAAAELHGLPPASESSDQLPASSSFAKLPHHPSPFDEISGFGEEEVEKENVNALSLPTSASHSRQSSSGGAKFVVGSMEHIPDGRKSGAETAGKVDNLDDAAKLNAPRNEELQSCDVKGANPQGDGFDASKDLPLPSPISGELQTFSPPPMAKPGTSAGIPARNQFRKASESKSIPSSDFASGSLHLPFPKMSSGEEPWEMNPAPPVQYTGSSGTTAEDGAAPSVASSQMHSGGAAHLSDDIPEPPGAELGHSQSSQNHQVNIYAMPLAAHPGSSFVPVGARPPTTKSDAKNFLPPNVSGEPAPLGKSDVGNATRLESDVKMHRINPEQDQGFHHETSGSHMDSASSAAQKQRFPSGKDVQRGEKLKEFRELPSQLHAVLPKLHRDKTMSPAATLWENPDPLPGVGISLVPATGVIKEEIPSHSNYAEYGKSALDSGSSQQVPSSLMVAASETMQNTGTGPGKKTGSMQPQANIQQMNPAFGSGIKGAEDQSAQDSFSRHPQPAGQSRNPGYGQQHSIGAQNRQMGVPASLEHAEVPPRSVTHVRNESMDSLTEEITKSRDLSNIDSKAFQHAMKPAEESNTAFQTSGGPYNNAKQPRVEGGGVQKMPSADFTSGGQQQMVGQEAVNNPRDAFPPPERNLQRVPDDQGNFSSDVQQSGPKQNPGATHGNPDVVHNERSQPSSGPGYSQNPYERQGSRQESYGNRHSAQDYSRNPHDRQGYPAQESFSDTQRRPDSHQAYQNDPKARQGYPEDPHNRPGSRQGYPEDPYGRPRSRQGYPDDPYGRPRSRQGYPDDPYDRPRSRQGYPEHDRPRSRQGYPEQDRPGSRQGYPERERPGSRQGYPERDRPGSRQGYPEHDRPRSRQGYQHDVYDRSRDGYDPEKFDRPRSRPGYPDFYPDDPNRRPPYYPEGDRSRQGGYYDRPRSRQDYDYPDRDNRGYSDQDESRSRRGRRDDYKGNRGYSDESYKRPRSRQNDSDHSSQGYEEPDRSYSSSRHPEDRSRLNYDPRSRRGFDRERYDYDEYYRDYYNRYMQYMYQQSGYQQYYPYQYPNRYDEGYLKEMAHYGQIPAYDPRYGYEAVGKEQHGSHHGSTRGSSPVAHDQFSSSAADNFAREYHQGSRPGSSFSGAEPSSIVGIDTRFADDQYDSSYGYSDQLSYREPDSGRLTPFQYIGPHTRASFSPTGQLIHVLPNRPADSQPATVELIDVASLLAGNQEVEELKKFPGPLIRHETHKNDVLLYCQKMALECRNSEHLVDRESAELLWHFLELLIKQNGTVIGTDVADLLLDGHEPSSSAYAKTGLPIASSHEDLEVSEDGLSSTVSSDRSLINRRSSDMGVDEATDRFRHLLLHGRKKDALEWAMKKNLWGHALFLASKMDAKTHASIMTRFANVSMKMNDPLQTLYQIMSGRQPASVTLIADDKWGDWRPHLGMMLSNPTQKAELDKKSIVTLGDTLASRGLLFSAQFCYVMAQVPFGHYHKKSSKIVLLGATHCSPFEEFASNFAIQCTETYEYGLSLATPNFVLPMFQSYKFIYLLQLIDYGFFEEALKYAEVLSGIIVHSPSSYSPTLAKSLYNISYGLRQIDPQRLLLDENEDVAWFQQLRQVVMRLDEGSILYHSGQGTPVGGLSTGASSEVAEILGQTQVGDVVGHQQTVNFSFGGAAVNPAGVAYQDPQNQWTNTQAQQMTWNPAGQMPTWDQYMYQQPQQQQQQWDPSKAQSYSQQGQWYPTVPNTVDNGVHDNFSNSAGTVSSTNLTSDDRPDGVARQNDSNFPSESVDQFPMHDTHSSYTLPPVDSISGTSFGTSYGSSTNRQRTTSSSSSHSQRLHSSRRTSSSTVHGATPPSSPGNQMSGSSAPLGVPPNTEQKKKQTWPGEEPDENDKGSKAGKNGKSLAKNKDGSKSTGWFGGLMSKFSSRPKEMLLPDDKNPKIIWSKEKNRWVNQDEDANESDSMAKPLAPPKDAEVTQKMSTPSVPMPSPGEFSGNKFSRQKVRGARGQYVDVLSGSSKPSPVAPNNLLNMMPKSASMPPNVFIPNAQASEEEEERASSEQHAIPHPSSTAVPAPAMAIPDQPVVQKLPEKTFDPPAMQPPQMPLNKDNQAATGGNPADPMPMMFNPAQFHALSTPLAPTTVPNAHSLLKYGQRRVYPK